MKSTVALHWLTAARAEFVKPSDWRAWADKLIVSLPTPPFWLIGMSLAMNVAELRKAFEDVLDTLDPVSPTTVDNVVLGYIWWRFERDELGLHDCLRLAGEAADSGVSNISCEKLFEFLNRLEAGNQNEKEIEAAARELLSPFRRLAELEWMEIQACP